MSHMKRREQAAAMTRARQGDGEFVAGLWRDAVERRTPSSARNERQASVYPFFMPRSLSALLALLFVWPLAASADVRVLVDADESLSTGCSVPTGAGTLGGIEEVAITTTDATSVTRVDRQRCVAGVLGAPEMVAATPWPIGRSNDGTVQTIESWMPTDSTHPPRRLIVIAGNVAAEITTPSASGRRHASTPPPMSSGETRSITLDGKENDWTGIAPSFTSRSALRDVSMFASGQALYLLLHVAVGQGTAAPPTVSDDAYSVPRGGTLNISAPGVLSNDVAEGDAAMFAIVASSPAHGVLTLSTDGSLSYVHGGGPAANDSFTYRANSGGAESAPSTVTISVVDGAGGPGPVATNDSYATNEDLPLDVDAAHGVLANDSGSPADPLSASVVDGPAKGTLALHGDGSFTYIPQPDVWGTDSFVYKVSGASGSSTATVTITINSVNDAPSFVLNSQPAPFNEDNGPTTVLHHAVSIMAGPPNESAQSVHFVMTNDNPSLFTGGGQPAVSPDGTLSFTPAPDASGVANVTMTLHDDGGTANGGVDAGEDRTFFIEIRPVNDAPVITHGPAAMDQYSWPVTFTASNHNEIVFSDVDAGDAAVRLTIAVGHGTAQPSTTAGLTVEPHAGSTDYIGTLAALNGAVDELTLSPAGGYTGLVTLDLTLNDLGNSGSGGALAATFHFSMSNPPPPRPVFPVVTAGGTTVYHAHDPATVVDPNVTVTDDGDTMLTDVQVQIRPYDTSDVLSFTETATIKKFIYDDGTYHTLVLMGKDTLAHYQEAMRSITFTNTSATPRAGARTIFWLATDTRGYQSADNVTSTIDVVP